MGRQGPPPSSSAACGFASSAKPQAEDSGAIHRYDSLLSLTFRAIVRRAAGQACADEGGAAAHAGFAGAAVDAELLLVAAAQARAADVVADRRAAPADRPLQHRHDPLAQPLRLGRFQQMAGQNERSFPVVIQYVDDKSYVVWPKSQAQREAVLPLPKGTTFSNQ